VPRLCEFYPGICPTTEEKARKTSVRVRKTSVRVRKTSVRVRKTSVRLRKATVTVQCTYYQKQERRAATHNIVKKT